MKVKLWILTFLMVSTVYISTVTGINFIVDPYWYFSYKNYFNTHQQAFNERQQKSNFLRNTSEQYDSILIGSSRTSYINQNAFTFTKVYNFSVSSMRPIEYKSYIGFFKKQMKNEPKYIIIGMDFAGTNRNRPLFDSTPPRYYFDNSKFSVTKFMSYDLMKKSLHNIQYRHMEHYDDAHAYYDRNNVKYIDCSYKNLSEQRQRLNADVNRYKKDIYGSTYQYDSNLSNIFNQLKKDNPSTKIIVFTTPISKPLFNVLVEEGRLPDYERWLRSLVKEFGSVWHFMDINSVTTNYSEHFTDGHHAYPKTANMIARKISNPKNPDIPADFGILLTADNIDNYLNVLEKTHKKRERKE